MKKYFIILFFAFFLLLTACGSKYKESAYYEAINVEKTDYKKILGSKNKDLEINEVFSDALLDFSYETASKLLEDRNGMYSPISLYIALSELVELTGGDTQKEVLDALQINDIEILRDGNQKLFNKLSYENKVSTLRIANSIWLNKNRQYKHSPLEILRDKYYASSYGIDFSKEEDKKLIGQWVSDNTGGKLGNNDFNNLDPTVIFVLLNTIYFQDEWDSKFDKSFNEMGAFAGLEKNVEYMNQELQGFYYKNSEYESSYLRFKNGLRISFVAPNDFTKIGDFISDSNKLKNSLNNKEISSYLVNYRIPKFTYKSSFDLIDYARTIGINKVFDIADFSPFTDTSLYVSAMYQKTFIEIDEEGGKAGAYTAIIGDESAGPSEQVMFNLNRPFVYAIYSGDYPLFIGVVTNPGSSAEENYK